MVSSVYFIAGTQTEIKQMHNVMVEVLNEEGNVITHATNMAGVELVMNIQEHGRMMVTCAAGTLEIIADRNIHDQSICIQIKNGNSHVGYMWPESFVKIYM